MRSLQTNVRLLILDPPALAVPTMLASAADVFSFSGISINVLSIQHLHRPELSRIAIGNCLRGQMTVEQVQLFDLREGAGGRDIVVYFVEETIPASLGCSAHPPERPAIIITRLANRWTLAHELAHVLGLQHLDQKGNLMTTAGTGSLDESIPTLFDYQIAILRNSPFCSATVFHPGI